MAVLTLGVAGASAHAVAFTISDAIALDAPVDALRRGAITTATASEDAFLVEHGANVKPLSAPRIDLSDCYGRAGLVDDSDNSRSRASLAPQ